MFSNLIESSFHSSEFKRRGSFFLFTSVTYLLLFAIAGVASIYAYDARLEDPGTEIIAMLNPMDFDQPNRTPDQPVTAHSSSSNNGGSFVRRNPTARVNDPHVVPTTTSAVPSTNPPLPPGARFKIGDYDADPGTHGSGGPGIGGLGDNTGVKPSVIDVGPPPTIEPIHKPVQRVIRKAVLNGQALLLPKPAYPPIAKQLRVQGTVNVQVLIDETGKVVSAKAVSGNPALVGAAQNAAFGARFSPTMLGDQPVKVSGVITYNFILQ